MKLKGTMVLELTDTNTGEVERVEETNMLTNVLSRGHPFLLTVGTEQIMTMPVSMPLLMEMMVRYTRHFRGIIVGGMAVVLAIIPTSAWKCVNRLVSNTLVVLHLPALIRRLQKMWQRELMKRLWNCSPCSAKSMT